MRARMVFGGSAIGVALLAASTLGAGALTGSFTEVEPASPGGFVFGAAVNDAGQVAGTAEFASGMRGFVREPDGTFTELDALPGDSWSSAASLNESGDVVGESEGIAVLWEAGGAPLDLGTLPGSTDSSAADINDDGWIVGRTSDTGQSWYRDPDTGTLAEIEPVPGGTTIQVRAINNSEVAVGRVRVAGSFEPFTWTEAGGMVLMPLPDGEEETYEPTDINDSGQIIGHVFEFIAPEGVYRNYLHDPVDGYTQLTMDGFTTSFPQAINDEGLVVGFVDNEGSSSRTPAAWDTVSGDAAAFSLFAESAFTNELNDVNNSGLAVGISREGEDFERTFVGQISPDAAPTSPTPSTPSTPRAPAASPAEPASATPSFTG